VSKTEPIEIKSLSTGEVDAKPNNYKTVLCKWYERFGKCTIEDCTFAHGQKELVLTRPSYKKNSSTKEEGAGELKKDGGLIFDDPTYDDDYYNEYDQESEFYKKQA